MKLIVFFIESLANGAGTERIAVDLANSLVTKGFCVKFIILDRNKTSFFTLNSCIQVDSLCLSFSQKKQAVIKLRQYLKQHKPDYLINVAFQMAIISLFSNFGCKTKIITWDHFFLRAGSIWGYLMRLISALCGYKQIVLTETDKKSYPALIQDKVYCIPNFTTINPQEMISSLDSKKVLSIGRLTFTKGFDLLVKAWEIVHHKYPDWKLEIVGEGDDRDELCRIIDRLSLSDSIYVLHAQNNILPIYLSASLYVLPSRYEPFGLVLIEAKSCGLPIVAFNCPFGPKNIVRDSIDGLLVEPENSDQLAIAICSLISDHAKLQEMGQAAISDYKYRWSEDIIMKQWMDLLK